jgi:hypothetical protein
MAQPPHPDRLDYRSGRDTLADEAAAMHRSAKTWLLLSAVWVVGVCVWVVYLAAIAYAVVRVLS